MRETLVWKFRILRVCDKNQEQLATYTLNRFSFEQRWSAREHHSLTTGICFYCHRHIHIHVAHKPSRMFALCLPPFVTTQHNSVLPSTTLIIQRFKDRFYCCGIRLYEIKSLEEKYLRVRKQTTEEFQSKWIIFTVKDTFHILKKYIMLNK